MSITDKLHQRQMALRKKSGLPHPDYYKELGHSYGISDDNERLAKQAEIKKKYKVEEVEQLDEMPESSMKTRDVHAHLRKSGWALARSSGGHDVYKHPKAKHSIPVPRHNQLKAPLIRGIMKASRVSEETEIEEQLEKKGRFVSGPVKKPYKSSTIVTSIKEAKDAREYDYEGDMAMSQIRSLMFNAQDMMDLMEENTNLPEWVQSKITLAEDYISTAANYLRGELNEEVKRYVPSPHGTPVPKKPKGEYERKVDKYLKKKYNKEEVELDEGMEGGTYVRRDLSGRPIAPKSTLSFRKYAVKSDGTQGKELKVGTLTPYTDKEKRERDSEEVRSGHISADKYKEHMKKYGHLYNKEEVELSEGRPSQRHPLEGHEYHKKTNAELEYIAKDAHKAAEAMKSHNTTAENKYRDQANDSATVRYFRKKSGMPDWYKKKYGHVKEEVEQLEEKNVPTSPEKWAQAKAQAKSKFDVYPSAYANGWAAKKYKEMGGGWKSVSENTDDPSAAARTLSRKAQIVRDAAKGKKQEQEQASDKFQKDPELSSDIQKT
jgi:predicted RNA binding protein YcfA (HicA-like mRNA interferase family)